MSLDSNTAELNEILDMAKGLPEAGGGVQEIVYMDCTFDMSTLSVSSDVTYKEIKTAYESGKYIIGRTIDSTGMTLMPLTSFSTKEIFVFSGMLQANLGSGLIVLHVTVEVTSSNQWIARVRLVSATDLN